jgi:hypothetical protein
MWCLKKGFFVSWAKLAMVAVTFSVMYLTYVPNAAMQAIIEGLRGFSPDVPDWSFRLGFSTVGMVHVSQYLAIVWKYNRGLVRRAGGREGIFTKLFVRGGLSIACGYVLVCLLYGFVLTDRVHPLLLQSDRPISEAPILIRCVIGALLAGLFTSTILHYYYDGFIWKVRHKENRQNLDLQDRTGGAQTATMSWWDNAGKLSAARTIAWQSLYFAVPMVFLAGSYYVFMSSGSSTPLRMLKTVLAVPAENRDVQSKIQALQALAVAEQRLAIEQRMGDLRPRGDHFVYAYELIDKMDQVRTAYLPEQFGEADSQQAAHDAIKALENALAVGGEFVHVESDPPLTRRDIEEALAARRRDMANLHHTAAAAESNSDT